MSISIIILIGIVLFICSTIQEAVGFAFNIFAIPLLIWSGLSLPQAITVTSIPMQRPLWVLPIIRGALK